jgi:multiple sugar transport system substrate-binding protein
MLGSHACRARSLVWVVTLAAAAMLVAACGSSSSGSGPSSTKSAGSSGKVVHLTFWSWVPGIGGAVNDWNATHKSIQISLDETTSGSAGTYAKMFSALQAGNAPDLGQIEYSVLPQFEHVGGLVNLAPYGAASVKSDFQPWTWQRVALGSDVYAIPQDIGPEGLFYRADLFKKYGLAVPTTWQQYLSDAEKLHNKDPKAYIAAFPANDAQWFAGLVWQNGGKWFSTAGNSWVVDLNGGPSQKVASLWQQLLSKHLVKVEPDFANGWYKDLSDGTVLSWPSAVWGANTLETNAANTKGDWRVAPMPQWSSGASADGDWGGSTTVVFKGTKYPKQAAEFAEWLNSNPKSINVLITKGSLYPADTAGESQPVFKSGVKFYGGQNIWTVFRDGAAKVNTSFEWGPLMSTTFTQIQDNFASAMSGSGQLSGALSRSQSQTITTLKQKGFSVRSG